MFRLTRPVCRFATAAALAAAVLLPPIAGGSAEAIVGGVGVSPSIYPAFVKLHTPTLCGGTVIAPDVVLTAAHCVDGSVTPGSITAFVSDVNPRSATAITIHPLWNGDLEDGHDLALVDLTPGATAGITPVQVGSPWNTGYYAPGFPATIVGHGKTSGGGSTSAQLRAVDTELRSDGHMDDIYNKWYWFDDWNEPLMIGGGSWDHTACDGDSGGPLFVDKDGTWTWIQVGVASFVLTWPSNCREPAGFSELSGAHLAWIAHNVPSVKAAWGTCLTPSGHPGQSSARYVGWFLPTGHKDGPFYWEIACYGAPPPPPTTTTTTPGTPPPSTDPPPDPGPDPEPEPEPDPTIPIYCRTKPWMCEDL
jgi:V8-like Glu-specific endopeptidase